MYTIFCAWNGTIDIAVRNALIYDIDLVDGASV